MSITPYFKVDKGNAAYSPQQGWKNTGYWQVYADLFAQPGSEDQLLAALTKSAPEQWLKERAIGDDDNFTDTAYWGTPGPKPQNKHLYEGGDLSRLDHTPKGDDYYLDQYGKLLTNRLRNDFKKNRFGMEQQGVANLRDQSEDALKDQFRDIDEQANARGLLHSGIRQGTRARAAAQNAGEFRNSATDYLQSVADTERNLNSDVFSSEMNSALKTADMNELLSGAFYNRLQRNIDKTKGQAQAAQNIGSGIGSFLGSVTGGRK